MNSRYVLISPCRNEAAYAQQTLDSVTSQTVPPALWVIVDDGSTDAMPSILSEYAKRFDYIRVIRREDRGSDREPPCPVSGEEVVTGGVLMAGKPQTDTVE